MVGKFMTSTAAMALLTGCAMFSDVPKSSVAATPLDMSDYFDQRLEQGRQHLAANRPTLAIEAFRQASYDERNSADAYNGMAVAYTMLGRDDVAERLFLRAIEADPTEPKYARNLARLQGQGDRLEDAGVGLAMAPPIPAPEPEIAAQPIGEEMDAEPVAVVSATGGNLKPYLGGYLISAGEKAPERVINTRAESSQIGYGAAIGPVSGTANQPETPEDTGNSTIKNTVIRTGAVASVRALKSVDQTTGQPKTTDRQTVAVRVTKATDQTYPIRVQLNRTGKEGARPARSSTSSTKLSSIDRNQSQYPIRVKLRPSTGGAD